MAIWTLAPSMETPPEIEFSPGPTLITTLSDGKEITRKKHANAPETWTENYSLTGTEFDAALALFQTYGTDQILTKRSYDVASSATTERQVCFNSFHLIRQGEDFFEVSISWRRVYP